MNRFGRISISLIVALGTLGTVASFAATGTVNTDQTTFRKEASTAAESYGYFYEGDTVEVIEKSGDWYKVKSGDNTGFIYESLIDVAEEPATNSSTEPEINQPDSNNEITPTDNIEVTERTTISDITNIYKIPSLTSKSISTIAKGTKVNVEKSLNKWVYITTENTSGWIREYCLEEHIATAENTPEETTTPTEQPEEPEEQPTNTPAENISTTPTITRGYISVDAANVRKEPNVSSEIVTTLLNGAGVEISEDTGEWYKVTYGSYTGYVKKTLVSATPIITSRSETRTEIISSIDEALANMNTTTLATYQPKTGYVNVSTANVRKEASTSSAKYTTLSLKAEVNIIGEINDFYKISINGVEAYIAKRLVSDNLSDIETTPVATPNTEIATGTTGSATGESIANYAAQYLGYSYVYGGTSPSSGFDCSGFTYYIVNSCGISLSRSCSAQAQSGTAVSKSELQVGDLVFFNNTSDGSIGHVGIYIGNGMMIHAANPSRGVVKDSINSGYYYTYYYSARRVAN